MRQKVFICLFFFLQLCASSIAKEWTGSAPGGFSAQVSFSQTILPLTEDLTVDINLSHPDDYEADLRTLLEKLTEPNGFSPAPFILVKKTVETAQKENKISKKMQLTLSPQLSGTHTLLLQSISFAPKNSEKSKRVSIIFPVFEINVSTPQDNFKLENLIVPPLPWSVEIPISINTENRINYLESRVTWADQAKLNSRLIQSKAIPWILLPCLAVILLIIAIRKSNR
jgi:hypothetical protein